MTKTLLIQQGTHKYIMLTTKNKYKHSSNKVTTSTAHCTDLTYFMACILPEMLRGKQTHSVAWTAEGCVENLGPVAQLDGNWENTQNGWNIAK